jgi:hypothetical protein
LILKKIASEWGRGGGAQVHLTKGDENGFEGVFCLVQQNQEGPAPIRELTTLEDILEVAS